jgi:UDP-glucose 4-epimerase
MPKKKQSWSPVAPDTSAAMSCCLYLAAGARVAVVDNLSNSRWSAVLAGVSFIHADAGDGDLISRTIESHVMHFAGSIVVPDSVANPLAYYANNTVASHALIGACVRTGVRRFIFSSKLMTEMILRDVSAAHDLRYVALRYFNVAGADPLGRAGQSTPKATHLIKAACELAIGARPQMTIYGADYPTPDGTCTRDYIHVTDLADAHVSALRYLQAGGPSIALNCGYGRGYSVREVLKIIEAAAGHLSMSPSGRAGQVIRPHSLDLSPSGYIPSAIH